MTSSPVTLVVHGTFAQDEAWWRLGAEGSSGFANELEKRLAADGMAGTVWRPALEQGMKYEDFSWSGRNRHRDRLAGAEKLAGSLEHLAAKVNASAEEPLEVNFIAHSHGGNVVLEALKNLPRNVRARRLVMLGTPLVWKYPSGRLWSLLASMLLPWAVLTVAIQSAAENAATPEDVANSAFLWLLGILLLFGPYSLLYYRFAKRIVSGMGWFTGWFRRGGNDGLPAYGPRPAQLIDGLGEETASRPRAQGAIGLERRPMLITSAGDEADLALHLGASPTWIYDNFVKQKLKGVLRLFETLWLRGMFSIYIAPVLETAGEHVVLGFQWRKVVFNDYEMVSFRTDRDPYDGAIDRDDVTRDLVEPLQRKLAEWRPASLVVEPFSEDVTLEERRERDLRAVARNVVADAVSQLQLRHTVYYETPAVLDRIAACLH